MNADWRTRYDAGIEAAQKAGELAMQWFDADVAVQWKADESPVTIADQSSEKLLRETLLSHFPNDGFLGEEYGAQPGTSGYRWIIDPIDGTRSFVRGVPLWGTLVGLEYQEELIAGICCIPAIKQTYRALRGDGAYRDSRRIRVSDVADLSHAHLYYSSIGWFKKANAEANFLSLYHQTERQRGFGDFYGFVLVAQGAGDVMVEHGVHAWDIAALIPIVEEAGGKMTAWDGTIDLERPDVIATNGVLHDKILAHLAAGFSR
ncbi:MAG: histidinol phosphate phosphatase [Gemmataceae bacterium]|nr:histidinol phosphate phosphatase [Gemmataceae bacterium]